MNPFDVLGLSHGATVEQAKAAYRKLAMEHHPDRGGSETKFKEVKAAWESIEKGWRPPPPNQSYASSFSEPKPPPKTDKQSVKPSDRPSGATAGKPAPGYEARGKMPDMPHTTSKHVGYGGYEHFVTLEITADQAFEGCVVPFVHKGGIMHYEVRPGYTSRTEKLDFIKETMIGSGDRGVVSITVKLIVSDRVSDPDEKTRDAEIAVNLCALGLFTGGRITVVDHLGEKIPIVLPAGYDPQQLIAIQNHGFGREGQRGTLFVKIKPTFKAPSNLNAGELRQLQALNEMAKK